MVDSVNAELKSKSTVKKRQSKNEWKTGLLFVLPGLTGFIVFVLIPFLMSFFLSFTEWNFLQGIDAIKFNGINNYLKLSNDEWFVNSFWNNIIFTIGTVPVLLAVGLMMAAIIDRYIKYGGLIKVLVFIPYIASVVAIATVWMMLFEPTQGPINQFLMNLGVTNPPGWLTSFEWSLPSIMIVYIWQQLGYFIIVFTSGLKSIPEEVYEAADMDGAGPIRKFLTITVPMMSPTTFFLATMGIIGTFKVFDQVSVMTQGGPGSSSSVMAYYIYRAAFLDFETGYSNALAWALFGVIFIVTIAGQKAQRKYVDSYQ
jgi:ABC-type sugar transport systems, permease components